MEKGAEMGHFKWHPKSLKNPYKIRCRKIIEKSSKKHEKMKVSHLENHGVSEGKTHNSQKSRFTN